MTDSAATLTADDVTPETADDLVGMLELAAIPVDQYYDECTFRAVIIQLADGKMHLADYFADNEEGEKAAQFAVNVLKQQFNGVRATKLRRVTKEV